MPGRVPINDLKPELRRKLFPLGAPTRSARAGKVRTVAPEGKAVWRCIPCGVDFHAYATVQKHIDTAHGGGRIEFVLDNKENS